MTTWQPNQPTAGLYSGQPDPPQPYSSESQNLQGQPGFQPQSAYPTQPEYSTQPPNYPSPPPMYEGLNNVQPTIIPSFAPPPPPGFTSLNSQQGMYGSAYGDDPLSPPDGSNFEFTDKTIRRGFLRKVYSILMCQLSITTVFIAIFTYHEPTQKFLVRNPGVFYIALIFTFVTLIAMSCCPSVRRKYPKNIVFLFIFTVAESVLLGTAAATYHRSEVVMAAGICAAVCLGLSIFAFQTKWDFTVLGGILVVSMMILFMLMFVLVFFPWKAIAMLYASMGALLFCAYLVYDTQMMIGCGKFSISPEEYVFAALNLYLDIINIFMYILAIIGMNRD